MGKTFKPSDDTIRGLRQAALSVCSGGSGLSISGGFNTGTGLPQEGQEGMSLMPANVTPK